MTDLKMCSFFFYFSERRSVNIEEHQRSLLKGTSFAKAAEVWTARYKKRCKYMYFEQMLFLIPLTQHATLQTIHH